MAKVLEGTEAWTVAMDVLARLGRLRGRLSLSRVFLGVVVDEGRTFGCREVYHVPILFEHVDFLDGLDGLHIELLQ